MNQRYFRCLAGNEAYESVRLSLDLAWGHVSPRTCISPATVAPRDSEGHILLAVWDYFVEYPAAAAFLPELLASGQVVEINAAEYRAAFIVAQE